jgi:hypothetical protein
LVVADDRIERISPKRDSVADLGRAVRRDCLHRSERRDPIGVERARPKRLNGRAWIGVIVEANHPNTVVRLDQLNELGCGIMKDLDPGAAGVSRRPGHAAGLIEDQHHGNRRARDRVGLKREVEILPGLIAMHGHVAGRRDRARHTASEREPNARFLVEMGSVVDGD